ncbi:MAG TPA: lipoyl(octanoyl) transferase LipB [Chloroflexota bacterium]|nr:lipoyl(octanoyl) transferase LipB [Chloroflexota bacterium]
MERLIRRAAPYVSTWEWQRARAEAVGDREAPEALLLVEHLPVYTLGQRSDPAHLLHDQSALRALGADVVWSDRGGDVTWHGPGQITGYPILDLNTRGRDLHAYVTNIEQLLIDVCSAYGIEAHRADGMPGVWVGREKVAAIGVRFTRRWVTYHGFALNVSNDVAWFEHIVPCGLHGFGVTTLSRLLGRTVEWEEAAQRVSLCFDRLFEPHTAVQSDRDLPGRRGADHVGGMRAAGVGRGAAAGARAR